MNDQQTITDEQIRLVATEAARYRRALLDILRVTIIYKDHGDQREAAMEIARKALAE